MCNQTYYCTCTVTSVRVLRSARDGKETWKTAVRCTASRLYTECSTAAFRAVIWVGFLSGLHAQYTYTYAGQKVVFHLLVTPPNEPVKTPRARDDDDSPTIHNARSAQRSLVRLALAPPSPDGSRPTDRSTATPLVETPRLARVTARPPRIAPRARRAWPQTPGPTP